MSIADKILQNASNLIKMNTVQENKEIIMDALQYCIDYFKGKKVFHKIFKDDGIQPVAVISNIDPNKSLSFDILTCHHIDIVPCDTEQLKPKIQDGKFYGRGALDMKTWLCVSMNTLEYIVDNNIPVKFAILITTDEETTATGAEYITKNTDINAKLLLDPDVAGDINEVIHRCKSATFIKLIAEGVGTHGSLPWNGIDANEKIMQVISKIRQHFKYYSKDGEQPERNDAWVDTMHIGEISGGSAVNVISSYCYANLDFRLTENTPNEKLFKLLDELMIDGVRYEVINEGILVNVDENNIYMKTYLDIAEKIIGKRPNLASIGGATDARHFAKKMPLIMHSGSGDGEHGLGEYCLISSVEQLAQIQIEFIKKFAEL